MREGRYALKEMFVININQYSTVTLGEELKQEAILCPLMLTTHVHKFFSHNASFYLKCIMQFTDFRD